MNPEIPPPIVVTDSTSDLSPQLLTERGLDIKIVNAAIAFGELSFIDRVDISMEKFYRMLQSGKYPHPTTASPGPAPFTDIYKEIPDSQHILSIHVGSSFSGFYQHSIQAAQDVGRTDGNFTAYDTGTVTLALGFLAMEAAQRASEGYPPAQIISRLDNMKQRTHMLAMFDTLTYLRKSGRISLPRLLVGSALDLKPILRAEQNLVSNVDLPLQAIRTRSKALPQFIQLALQYAPFERVGVVHANNLPLAQEVAHELAQVFDEQQIVIADVTPALVVHAGPNAVGICVVQQEQ